MLFSIIVPVYNVEEYLEECIQSIMEQVLCITEQCEVLLINDGSTDSSGNICDMFQEQYPRIIKVFHNANHGLLLTRRFGYKKATGEYIVNCDSDDKLENNALEKLKGTINEFEKPDVMLFNYYLYRGTSKEIGDKDIFTSQEKCAVVKKEVLKEFTLHHSIVSVCGKCFKRTCIEVDKDYTMYARISNGEDSLQSLEIFDHANTYVYINEALYYYRMGSGMTQKYDPNYYFAFKSVIEEIEKRKDQWQLQDFDRLIATKVLATAGRAITQSRLKKWDSLIEQKQYLKTIREDKMFERNIGYLKSIKKELQYDHIVLLLLLKLKLYFAEVVLLRIKNYVESSFGNKGTMTE